MRELIFLIIPLLQRDENAEIMRASRDSDIRACELRSNMIISSCIDPLIGAIDPECRHRRMMRRLLCKIRQLDLVARRGTVTRFVRCYRGGAGVDGGAGVLHLGKGVVDFPCTLRVLSEIIGKKTAFWDIL